MNRNQLVSDFVNRHGLSGRASNLSYSFRLDGVVGTLVSYSTPIAVLRPCGDCLVATHRYSRTTSCHLSAVRSALMRAGIPIVEWDSIDEWYSQCQYTHLDPMTVPAYALHDRLLALA